MILPKIHEEGRNWLELDFDHVKYNQRVLNFLG